MKILIADDQALIREMLQNELSRKGKVYTVVGEAVDGTTTLDLVACHHPDLLLLDYKMPCLGRLSAFLQGGDVPKPCHPHSGLEWLCGRRGRPGGSRRRG